MDKKKISKKVVIISILVILLLVILSLVIYVTVKKMDGNKTVISINDIDFSKNDYMMYLRLSKTSLFDENTTRLPKATLNTIVDTENNINAETYLRNKTEESLKIAGVIFKLAEDNNISLNDEELKEIETEKQDYIEKLGGIKEFKKFLNDNRTTEEAYDKVAKLDKLYKKIYNELYAEGKKYDLSDTEKEEVKNSYELEYKKARQIFLLTVDPTTKEELSSSVVEQKKLLAYSIREQLDESSDFNAYIKKYSDDAIGVDPPYDMYFKDGQVLEEIENTVNKLEVGQISDVIKSEYGYHIIIRDKLDDGYLEKLYDSKRENNFLTAIYDEIKDSKIIIQDSFATLRVD